MKKLIPAFALLLVSAVLLSTASFAWFSMNTVVTAQNMQVKAVAEDGIVISNLDKSTWNNTADAKVTAASLVPASAKAVTDPVFVHATSTNAAEAQANQAVGNYTELALKWTNGTASNDGEGFVDIEGGTANSKDANEKSYVLLNKFYIKATGDVINLGDSETYKKLYISKVEATGASKKVENALRVLVVVGDTAVIYAPVKDIDGGTTTMSYKWKNTDNVTALAATTLNQPTSITQIGNTNETAVEARVYVYFEGEDANCASVNISGITTSDINVSVTFGITTIS